MTVCVASSKIWSSTSSNGPTRRGTSPRFNTSFVKCPIATRGGHEQHAAGFCSWAAHIGPRIAVAARIRPTAWRGCQMGDRLCPALCGGVFCLCCLSLRRCAVDGGQALALRRVDRGSVLLAGGRQYPAVRRSRREPQDVLGLAGVRLLHTPALVDQGPPCRLYFALVARCGASLRLVSLDAAGGWVGQRRNFGAVRHRRPDLVQQPLAWAGSGYHCLHLEMDAVLDCDIPRRTDENSSRHL